MKRFILTLLAASVAGGPLAQPSEARPCHLKCKMKREIRPYNAKLERIANCESDQRWHINTHNGFYGGLQFKKSTWNGMGGKGYPHHHSETAQKYRAVKLIRINGYQPWPNCGNA